MGEEEEEVGASNRKRKQKAANKPTMKKGKTYSPEGLGPEYAACEERLYNELKFVNKWEWSDEDLLFSCQEYLLDQITKEDALKELPILRRYLQQRRESDGFDIDVRPKIGVGVPGTFPISKTEKQLQMFRDLAELAIESYNEKNDKTNYEVIKVVKVNVRPCGWDNYYLTFTAKDVSPRGRYRSPKTFQAIVLVPRFQTEKENQVELCRPKERTGLVNGFPDRRSKPKC